MGTRSLIAAKFDANVDPHQNIVATYCHWDGYLSGVGLTLLKQYNDSERAFTVADSGYVSSLPDLFEDFDSREDANEDDPIYFEDEWELLHSADEYSAEFVYLYADGQWYWADVRNVPAPGFEYEGLPFKAIEYADMKDELNRGRAYVMKKLEEKLSEDERGEYEESLAEFDMMLDLAESVNAVSH
jgi:hypothetical protein